MANKEKFRHAYQPYKLAKTHYENNKRGKKKNV